jgi:septal ring factor EnvC (AmiA/AmiB activator)
VPISGSRKIELPVVKATDSNATRSAMTMRRMTRGAALPLSAMLAALHVAGIESATAQTATKQVAAPDPEAIKQRTQELEAAREQKKAAELEQKLKAEIAAIGRSHQTQSATDRHCTQRDVEVKMADTEGGCARSMRANCRFAPRSTRRDEIAEVLAALQRAGRRAPPALFVRPEDALQSLRTAMLLGAVVPDMRARAAKLASDLGELVSLRKNIAEERDRLAADRDTLNEDRTRLAALVQERQRKQTDTEGYGATAARHRTLQADGKSSGPDCQNGAGREGHAKAAAAAKKEALNPPNGKPNLAALKDPARLSPAVAFGSARGFCQFR